MLTPLRAGTCKPMTEIIQNLFTGAYRHPHTHSIKEEFFMNKKTMTQRIGEALNAYGRMIALAQRF